jgi:hypothetical protein
VRAWIRRGITFVVVAAATAGGVLWWLYDGDLGGAIDPVLDDVVNDPAPEAPRGPEVGGPIPSRSD